MKPYHYLLVTLASAAITAACAPPNTAKPVLGAIPTQPGVAAANNQPANPSQPASGGSTGGTVGTPNKPGNPTPGNTTPGNTTPPATVTPPGVGTTPIVPPVSEVTTGGGRRRGAAAACEPGAYTQVERLARPAINEGLIRSNNLLNAFNSIPPTLDLDADNATAGTTVTAVQNEAVGTLQALGNKDLTAPPLSLSDNSARVSQIVNSFLPDVMRINTLVDSGYATADAETVGGFVRPATGRLLTDDTIDITLSVLVPTDVKEALVAPAMNPLDDTATSGVHSDFVDYLDAHRRPTNSFPYLVPPH